MDLGNGVKEFLRIGQATYGLVTPMTINTFYESVVQMDASLASNNTFWSLNGSNAVSIPNNALTPSASAAVTNSYTYANILISQIQIGGATSNEITSSFLVYTNSGGQKASVTQLQGSAGDDVFSWNSTQTQIKAIKGGAGFDTLYLPTGNLNNAPSTSLSLSGIDQIDLRQEAPVANQLNISLADIAQADNQTLVVRGESVDTVSVKAAQVMTTVTGAGTTVSVAGKIYMTDAQGKVNLASGGEDKFAVYRWTVASVNHYLLVSDVITQAPTVTLDTTAPTLTALARDTTTGVAADGTTALGSVDFVLTFGESMNVATFNAADLQVMINGVVQNSNVQITEPVLVTGNQYKVTVSGSAITSGNGVLSLALASGYSLNDLAGNNLAATTLTNLVTNGSFDTAISPGWSTTGNAGYGGGFIGFGSGGDLPNGTLTQTFTTTAGVTYTVTYGLKTASVLGSCTMVGTAYGADGTTVLNSYTTSVANTSYQYQKFTFTANGASTTLKFVETVDQPSNEIHLDTVVVTRQDSNYTLGTTTPLVLDLTNDVVNLDTMGWSNSGTTTTVDNHTYALWNNGAAHLLIDQNALVHQVL